MKSSFQRRGSKTCRVLIWLARLSVAGVIEASGPDVQKLRESAGPDDPPALELSAASAKFVEIATVGAQTNQVWGRAIPARVTLQISARASVGATVEGRVEQILVRPGDEVQAGDPLLKIHSAGGAQARAEAQQALARLQTAEENLRRYSAMAAKGVATELEKFDAELRVREAQIEVERTHGANSLLGSGAGVQYFITAPTNGVVLSISAAVGSALQPGNDVVEIGDPSKVWIEADVSDDEPQIFAGARGIIEVPHRSRPIGVSVETVAAHVDPLTRRRRIYLMPDNDPGHWLSPGMLVEARLAEPRNQLLLPVEAVLIKEGDRRFVYVQGSDGRLHRREVRVNSACGGHVHVVQGLSPGERVVVKGALLVDGRSEQLL